MLTSAKGRIVERLFVHHAGERGVLSVGGSGAGPRVVEHLTRFTFAEQTGLEDATEKTFQLALIGPAAEEALQSLGIEAPEPFQTREASAAGVELLVLGQDGSSGDGFSLVGESDSKKDVWDKFAAEVQPAGAEALEAWRILRGLPGAGHELTEQHNPLEAGLWDAVDFDKGCYVGQEVVARLRTYDKVSRAIVGLELPGTGELPEPGAKLFDGERPVGELTSAAALPGTERRIGLAYIKKRDLREAMELRLGDGRARVVELPFS